MQREHPDSIGNTDDDARAGAVRGSTASTPRWVYVCAIIVIVLVGLFVIRHLTGGGLGAHIPLR